MVVGEMDRWSAGVRGRPGLRSWALLAPLALGLVAVAPACSSKDKVAFDSGIPTIRSSMQVVSVREFGPYLEAHLTLDHWELEAYALPSEVCRGVFVPGESIRYVDDGPLGSYMRAEDRCQALGIGNLELWRDRSSRSTRSHESIIPRSQATYRLVYSDPEFVLLRGFFPQARQLRFANADDIVAVVPVDEVCSGPIKSGVASMEYRSKGRRALTLVGSNGLCVIRGLVMPPAQGKATKDFERDGS
ncbi:MAG: hypothetical protein JRG96_19165 [Deltaproteobacteria bacterium]|nr:hypothetical protein [Deltaproteobacteria bacterium]